jgi:hypothetical protein
LADPGEGPAGTEGGDDDIDRTTGVVPDFHRRRAPMDLGVGGISELIERDRAGGLADQLFGSCDSIDRPPRGRCTMAP